MTPFQLLQLLPPEWAHRAALYGLDHGWYTPAPPDDLRLATTLFGKPLPSPLLAGAGISKNGEALRGFQQLGLAGADVGTLMPQAHPGNRGRRLWRLADGKALGNWLGLPSQGPRPAWRRFLDYRQRHGDSFLLGANIAARESITDSTPRQQLEHLIRSFGPYVDYFTLNESCRNSAELANHREGFTGRLRTLREVASGHPRLVKLGPAESLGILWRLQDEAMTHGATGFTLLNATPYDLKHLLNPHLLPDDVHRHWFTRRLDATGTPVGSYSGPAAFDYTLDVVRKSRERLGAGPTLIATGTSSGAQAVQLLQAGADALYLVTGLVRQGEALLADIKTAILRAGGMQRFRRAA